MGEIGFEVKVIDFSWEFFNELVVNVGEVLIEIIEDDIRNIKDY